MEYNYEQEYNKVIKETQDILNEAKAQYQTMKDKYNEKTLQIESKQLVGNTQDKLMALKYKFLVEAREQLENQRAEILEDRKRERATRTPQDLMVELLLKQDTIQQFEANITLLGGRNCIDMLQEIQGESTFNVCKSKLLNAVNESDKLLVQQVKYQDPDLFPIEQALLSVKLEDSRVLEPLLPPTISNVESYITGEDMSNFFFGGDVNA